MKYQIFLISKSIVLLNFNLLNYTARPKITILDGSEATYGVEGRDFMIRCQAVGKPKPHYQWMKYAVSFFFPPFFKNIYCKIYS